MNRIRASATRLFVTVLVVGATLLPAAPASAHGRLPVGKYPCYIYVDGYSQYSYFDLHIRPRQRYALKLGDDNVGPLGRFRHRASGRIGFPTGYLATQRVKGVHERSPGDHTIRLAFPVNGDIVHYYCTD